MKICIISDSHGRHGEVAIPPSDVLIHCGDATRNDGRADLRAFLRWLEAQPAPHKIFVGGNHDRALEKHPVLARAMIKEVAPSVTLLHDSGCEIGGIRFWGSPYQPEFCGWAFNLPRGPELKAHWDLIPEDTDVLVTHCPPYGILDDAGEMVVAGVPMGHEHVGCRDLYEAVQRVKPVAHFFGHIPRSYGTQRYIHDDGWCTTMINAALCTEAYEPTNKPWIFDYEQNRILL